MSPVAQGIYAPHSVLTCMCGDNMGFRLDGFLLGDVVSGQIVEISPHGVRVNFGVGQPVYVRQSELSFVEIDAPEDVLKLNEVREFLVAGEYDGKIDHFFHDATPEILNDSDRLYEIAQRSASWFDYSRPVERKHLTVYAELLTVQADGVLVRIKWLLRADHETLPMITFSIRQLAIKTAWERIRQFKTEDATLCLTVVKKVRESAPMVILEGLSGFIANIDRLNGETVVGESLPLKIVEANEALNRLKLIRCLLGPR